MRQADITFLAYNTAALAAARMPTRHDEERFRALHAYALTRRDIDAQKRFPSAEVLARRHGEITGPRFAHASLEAAPRQEKIFWTQFRATIEALEPFRDEEAEPLFPPAGEGHAPDRKAGDDELQRILDDLGLIEGQELVNFARDGMSLNRAIVDAGITMPPELQGDRDALEVWISQKLAPETYDRESDAGAADDAPATPPSTAPGPENPPQEASSGGAARGSEEADRSTSRKRSRKEPTQESPAE